MSRGFQQNDAGEWVPFDDDITYECETCRDIPEECAKTPLSQCAKALSDAAARKDF